MIFPLLWLPCAGSFLHSSARARRYTRAGCTANAFFCILRKLLIQFGFGLPAGGPMNSEPALRGPVIENCVASWIAGVRRGSETQLVGDRDVAGLAASLRSILDLFVQADNLANYYKGRSGRTLVLLFVVAFLAIVALHTYSELWRTPMMLALYLLLLCGAYVW